MDAAGGADTEVEGTGVRDIVGEREGVTVTDFLGATGRGDRAGSEGEGGGEGEGVGTTGVSSMGG